jgi:hypothetical protein
MVSRSLCCSPGALREGFTVTEEGFTPLALNSGAPEIRQKLSAAVAHDKQGICDQRPSHHWMAVT